jgi:hypothetical protein
MSGLLQSRRFVTLLFNTIINTITFVIATYYPAQKELAMFMIGAWSLVAIAVIGGFTVDDFQAEQTARSKIEAATSIAQTKIYAAEPDPK